MQMISLSDNFWNNGEHTGHECGVSVCWKHEWQLGCDESNLGVVSDCVICRDVNGNKRDDAIIWTVETLLRYTVNGLSVHNRRQAKIEPVYSSDSVHAGGPGNVPMDQPLSYTTIIDLSMPTVPREFTRYTPDTSLVSCPGRFSSMAYQYLLENRHGWQRRNAHRYFGGKGRSHRPTS